jgi:hypothetical protein
VFRSTANRVSGVPIDGEPRLGRSNRRRTASRTRRSAANRVSGMPMAADFIVVAVGLTCRFIKEQSPG